ncbi:hypothetical protein J1N35_001248 [Gossypium stocksii]|uniref:Uncharacterized protein n=1 Tax=Gossypium stocksii TaxID=47602 RepID=A0A9D4AJF4_9ROSI|nr:hypothetical protein J1N35_001248 [Gossypium stocksii]
MEKGFLFQDATFMGYIEAISLVAQKHGWHLVCLHSNDVITKVVKEFYAHLTTPNNAFVYARGAMVLFDEYSINAKYGLPEGLDEHFQFVMTITVEELNQVLEDLCVEGTKWTITQNDCYSIDRVSLNPHCRQSSLFHTKEY